jgi:uncharacterized protein
MAKREEAQMIVKPTAENVMASVNAALSGTKSPPPLHLWNPPFCGDIDMRIARDGTWFYLGTPIARPALVRLFSSILRREGDRYVLVTPVEKVGIRVDDAPFVAVDFTVTGAETTAQIAFTTQVGDIVVAGADHPVRVSYNAAGQPSPYVLVREGLEALIDRKSFYRLVDLGVHAVHEGAHWFGVWSGGVFFPMTPSENL